MIDSPSRARLQPRFSRLHNTAGFWLAFSAVFDYATRVRLGKFIIRWFFLHEMMICLIVNSIFIIFYLPIRFFPTAVVDPHNRQTEHEEENENQFSFAFQFHGKYQLESHHFKPILSCLRNFNDFTLQMWKSVENVFLHGQRNRNWVIKKHYYSSSYRQSSEGGNSEEGRAGLRKNEHIWHHSSNLALFYSVFSFFTLFRAQTMTNISCRLILQKFSFLWRHTTRLWPFI